MNTNYEYNKKMVECVEHYVGSRIRMCRFLLGLSHAELGKRMGVDVEQVKKYEQGTSKIYAGSLYRLGQCLNVPISYFFENADDNCAMDAM